MLNYRFTFDGGYISVQANSIDEARKTLRRLFDDNCENAIRGFFITISTEEDCHTCDEHKGCDNCFYGQGGDKGLPVHCLENEYNAEGCTGWIALGDNYCRKCGRKLK